MMMASTMGEAHLVTREAHLVTREAHLVTRELSGSRAWAWELRDARWQRQRRWRARALAVTAMFIMTEKSQQTSCMPPDDTVSVGMWSDSV